jgi:hypothetical protein
MIKTNKRVQITVTPRIDAYEKFNQLYIQRFNTAGTANKGDILSDAIELLYKKEIKNEQ